MALLKHIPADIASLTTKPYRLLVSHGRVNRYTGLLLVINYQPKQIHGILAPPSPLSILLTAMLNPEVLVAEKAGSTVVR